MDIQKAKQIKYINEKFKRDRKVRENVKLH